ncbi:spore cortex-lytic enzyme [Paenibacillus ehimensis]|uniref:spore cortex-lytic enzyme n=1 Tax=Paenibacillus ehimensis TaxID=79264 RepID=UPI00398A51A1
MHRRWNGLRLKAILCLVLVFAPVLLPAPSPGLSFSGQTLRLGSRGDDVYELQGRLKFLGYYNGSIDGIFGKQTQGAVYWFQDRFGVTVDGIAGPQTQNKLWQATKHWRASGSAFSSEDITLMARTVYGEARGEPYTGQVAVAAVILNRLYSPQFPNTVSGVIFQPGAFTAVNDGQIWLTPDSTAYKAVHDAVNGWDPSGEALYYFNPATATSKWIWSRPQIKQIGRHIFCK